VKKDGLTQFVKKTAFSKGVDMAGIAPVDRFKGAPKGHHPVDVLPGCQSVISLGRRFLMGMIETLDPSRQRLSYKHHMYAHLNAYNSQTAFEIALLLENHGHAAFVIQPTTPYEPQTRMGVVSHRHAAVLAGLGVFGKSNLVLTPQFGPRSRFVTILTTAKLDADPLLEMDLCKKCDTCRKMCPAQAWDPQSGKFYKSECAHYQWWDRKTQECDKPCGICIKVCPVGMEKTRRFITVGKDKKWGRGS
jgi:epoxyqueuosine reductase